MGKRLIIIFSDFVFTFMQILMDYCGLGSVRGMGFHIVL